MEDQSTNDFGNIIESIYNILEGSISREIVGCVVENFNGDVNLSLDTLIKLRDESNEINEESSSEHDNSIISNDNNLEVPMSYAATICKTGTLSKTKISIEPKSPKQNIAKSNMWCEEFKKILSYHNQGYRTLILMRGVPGSGKSFMAQQIIESTIGSDPTDLKSHICSTDDFFLINNVYQYDKNNLSNAHELNKKKAQNAMDQGVSPVIIDNTNLEAWEMAPYVTHGVKNGYYIVVFEPKTPWVKNASILVKRNKHSLSFEKIKRMLDKMKTKITADYLLHGLQYPIDKTPPVLRSMPAPIPSTQSANTKNMDNSNTPNQLQEVNQLSSELATNLYQANTVENITVTLKSEEVKKSPLSLNEQGTDNVLSLQNLLQKPEDVETSKGNLNSVQKQLDEMNQIEQEWENGEDWLDKSENYATCAKQKIEMPKPQRSSNFQVSQNLEKFNHCEDWASMLVPKYDTSIVNTETVEIRSVSTLSTSTSVDSGDMDNKNNMLKVITAVSRDINEFYISQMKNNIPHKIMLDKSTMTNENVITRKRCENEDKHFKKFKKLFNTVPESALREIFDNCRGNVAWAINIMLDSGILKTTEVNGEVPESDDSDNDCTCSCLSAYDTSTHIELCAEKNEQILSTSAASTPKQKKQQKDVSAHSLQLKEHIEQNVVFSDEHYSPHLSKLVKKRRGEQTDKPSNETEENKCVDIPQSIEVELNSENCTSDDDADHYDDDEEHKEKTISVYLGHEFVRELDRISGRGDMCYAPDILPIIKIPITYFKIIDSLWQESLIKQIDHQDKLKSIMLRQDEELARTIAAKEAECTVEQDVPDFREIMDMDLALSLYQKEIEAEMRNREPDDLATILSRKKLYNLFPDVEKTVLSELLMAHNNDFKTTVEVLLISTGQSEVLSQKDGVNKFIVNKDLEAAKAKIEEEKKALSEVDWPLLPRGEPVEMSVVQEYRELAEQHLFSRKMTYIKANEYMSRGMYSIASFFSDIANYKTLQYEHASSLAAISLIQVHAKNNPDKTTIDLHYMRVGEAIVTHDLFLDMHIKQLRKSDRPMHYRQLFIITGRGRHSNGGPKIKPAIKKRLKERKLSFLEKNLGLLSIRVSSGTLMTHEIP